MSVYTRNWRTQSYDQGESWLSETQREAVSAQIEALEQEIQQTNPEFELSDEHFHDIGLTAEELDGDVRSAMAVVMNREVDYQQDMSDWLAEAAETKAQELGRKVLPQELEAVRQVVEDEDLNTFDAAWEQVYGPSYST